MKPSLRGLAFACLALLVAASAPAAETATVVGRVTDPSGGALAGATVTARNVNTGVTRTVVTTADGAYRIPVLTAGAYELRIAMASFAPLRRSGLTLTVGAEVTLDFALQVAGVTEELNVTSDVPVVETTNASVQTVINREQIDILPLIGRDFQDLARLSAGAVVTGGQGTSFTGSRGRSNSYVLDGVDNGEEISGFRRQDFNLDSVQEFQVLINNFRAEYGRASGGVFNVISRSGTNAFHGGAFFMYRDQEMIARDPFLKAGDPKDPFQRMQYGFHLGGPILKDRTHFFAAFEYQDRETNSTITAPYPAPGAVVSPATQTFLQRYNVPAFPDTRAGTLVRLVRPEYVTQPRFSARVDHVLSPAQTLTFRFNFEREEQPSGASGTIYDANGATDYSRTIYGTLNHKWIRGSNHLNELYLQFGKSKLDFYETNDTLPTVFIDEYSSGNRWLGGPTNYPQGREDTYFQIVDAYTIHRPNAWKGSHVLKFGGDAKIFRSDSFFDSNFRGSFFFRTVNDFLAGRPRRFTQNQGDTRLDRPNNVFAVYAQDDWTINRKLTLNLGLRYDYENGKTEALKGVPPGSPACALTVTCGEAGAGSGGDKNNFGPRLGVIWDIKGDGKTAVHAGIGLYYDQVILNIQGNARFTPPKVIGVQIENPSFPDPFTGGVAATLRPNLSVIDPELVTPRNLNSSLGVRREITRNIGIDATFVWNRGYDHVVIINTNSANPATGQRPNPNFTNVSFYTNEGDVEYRGLLVEVKKRMSRRHSWQISYTLGKAENLTETIFTGVQDPRNLSVSFGPADEDRLHVLAANGIVQLPWDIDVAAVFEFRSERPLDVFAGGRDLNGDLITGDYTPGYSRNKVRELSLAEANRLRSSLSLAPITAYADNPRWYNLDLTLQKRIRFGSSRALRLTLEAFNLFNHPNKLRPSGSITSSLFGQLTQIDVDRGARPRSLQGTVQFEF